MRLNFKKTICGILLASILSALFCGCGAPGKSAYELAVDNGYTGSLSEWLNSLRGADGKDGENGEDGRDVLVVDKGNVTLSFQEIYNAAVANGYTGSIAEYLGELIGASGSAPDSLVPAAARALMSTVSIHVIHRLPVQDSSFGGGTYPSASSGSGVLLSVDREAGNAYIMTNYHVVYDQDAVEEGRISSEMTVYLYGMENSAYGITAEYVGGSMDYDVAVLKVTGSDILKSSNACSATVADSDRLSVGQTVFACGDPESEGISISAGTVTKVSQQITVTASDTVSKITLRVFRTDASINHGNSGGGMFDSAGRLVGMTVAKHTGTDVDQIGYIIPSSIAVRAANNIIRSAGKYNDKALHKCLLGITITSAELSTEYNESTGTLTCIDKVRIDSVNPGSAADGHLKPDDILLSVEHNGNKTDILQLSTIVDLMLDVSVGDSVSVTFLRGEETLTETFTFTEQSISVAR